MMPLDAISVRQLAWLFFGASVMFAVTIWSLTQEPQRRYGCGLALLTMLSLGLEGMTMVWLGGLLIVKVYCGG